MKEKTFEALLQKIKKQRLKTVYLTKRKISDDHIKRLSRVLTDQKSIQELYLAGNLITDTGLEDLIELVKVNKHIKKISIGHNPINNNQRLNYLYQLLAQNRKMEVSKKGVAYNIAHPDPDHQDQLQFESKLENEFEPGRQSPVQNDQDLLDANLDDPYLKALELQEFQFSDLQMGDHQFSDPEEVPDPDEKLAQEQPWQDRVQSKIDYQFKNPNLLEQVIWVYYNQAIEMLGDAVFDVIKNLYYGIDEALAENAYLSQTKIAKILKAHLIVPQSKGKTLHGDATEALMGAVFLDCNKNHKIIEKVAYNIWGIFPLFFKIVKAKPEGLGAALRKLACVQIVLEQNSSAHSPSYCSTQIKDQLIHKLAQYDPYLLQRITKIFLEHRDYDAVLKVVKASISDIDKAIAKREQTARLQGTMMSQQSHANNTPLYGQYSSLYESTRQTVITRAPESTETPRSGIFANFCNVM